MILLSEPAVRTKCLVDGSFVVKDQVRVVPLSTELQGRIIMSRVFAVVIMGVDCRRSPLEIDAPTLFKTSCHGETVVVSVRRAENAFAADIGKGVAAAKRGRDGDVDCVVARGVGVHASPPGPLRIEVEMAAHEERPRRMDCIKEK